MAEPLNKDSDFVVKDVVILDILIAVFYFAMVLSVIIYNSGTSGLVFAKALLFGLLPGLLFVMKAFKNSPAIIINKTGIYYFKDLVTDWPHFYKATVIQLPLRVGGWQDRIILKVEYSKDVPDDLYKQELPLTDTQNKSEEDILAAIQFFYGLTKNK